MDTSFAPEIAVEVRRTPERDTDDCPVAWALVVSVHLRGPLELWQTYEVGRPYLLSRARWLEIAEGDGASFHVWHGGRVFEGPTAGGETNFGASTTNGADACHAKMVFARGVLGPALRSAVDRAAALGLPFADG